jgi:hypothetical protein
MTLEERLRLPEATAAGLIPLWAVEPEVRRREGREIAHRIEAEEGPDAAARALEALEREIEADEERWQQYLINKPRASA